MVVPLGLLPLAKLRQHCDGTLPKLGGLSPFLKYLSTSLQRYGAKAVLPNSVYLWILGEYLGNSLRLTRTYHQQGG